MQTYYVTKLKNYIFIYCLAFLILLIVSMYLTGFWCLVLPYGILFGFSAFLFAEYIDDQTKKVIAELYVRNEKVLERCDFWLGEGYMVSPFYIHSAIKPSQQEYDHLCHRVDLVRDLLESEEFSKMSNSAKHHALEAAYIDLVGSTNTYLSYDDLLYLEEHTSLDMQTLPPDSQVGQHLSHGWNLDRYIYYRELVRTQEIGVVPQLFNLHYNRRKLVETEVPLLKD